MTAAPVDLELKAKRVLQIKWEMVLASDVLTPPGTIPDDVANAIERSVNCNIKTYRYVLPTQLLAKCADPSLDCRSVQASADLPSAFDARSLCEGIIVPFDRENSSVLGGSPEPYTNNPMRIPAITEKHAKQQRNKSGFKDLVDVLEFAESNPSASNDLLFEVLRQIKIRMLQVRISYPVPHRTSIDGSLTALMELLELKSGGSLLQAVGAALFKVIGTEFQTYNSIKVGHVNSADDATGSSADVECLDEDGNIVLAIEIKDRSLSLNHLRDKLPAIRGRSIREFLFLTKGGTEYGDSEAIATLIAREYASGHNIYVLTIEECLRSSLVLLGEEGRHDVLLAISEQLEEQRVEFSFRKKWSEILQNL